MLIQAARREIPLLRSGALPDQLTHQLRLIYAAETLTAVELAALFRSATWVPLRLLLAGHRRKTNQHIDRLVCLLPTVDGRVAPPLLRVGAGHRERDGFGSHSAAVIAQRLRASQALLATYRPAVTLATARGLGYAASLLSRSVDETTEAANECAALAEELNGCPA